MVEIIDLVESHPGYTVEELVRVVSELEGIRVDKAARRLFQVLEEGKLRLEDASPPTGFPWYLRSWYSAWFWVAVTFIGLVMSSIYLLPSSAPFTYLRVVCGAVFALLLPGAVFIEALYPQREDLEQLERFGLSVGMSLALVPLVGLVLNYTPWGIRLDPVFFSLSMLTIVFGLIGVYRKYEYFTIKIETKMSGSS